MYVLIAKASKQVLDMYQATDQETIELEQLFPDFDPNHMVIGLWNSAEPLPSHLSVNENQEAVFLSDRDRFELGMLSILPHEKLDGDTIVVKSIAEQVAEGLIELAPQEKIENGAIVQKTLEEQWNDGLIEINEPFTYVEGNEIKTRSIQELVEGNFLTTEAHWKRLGQLVERAIERETEAIYPTSQEIKLMKACLDWLCEKIGEDDADPRRQNYLNMQTQIKAIEEKYTSVQETIDQKLSEYAAAEPQTQTKSKKKTPQNK